MKLLERLAVEPRREITLAERRDAERTDADINRLRTQLDAVDRARQRVW